MKPRSFLLRFVLPAFAVLGLVAATNAAVASGESGAGNGAKPGAVAGDVSTLSHEILIRGFDNIGYQGTEIVNLSGRDCTTTVGDIDYSLATLGNNNNQLSSIALSTQTVCQLYLYDLPNFDTSATYTIVPLGSGGCPNLGDCYGHNLWKRVNSLVLT